MIKFKLIYSNLESYEKCLLSKKESSKIEDRFFIYFSETSIIINGIEKKFSYRILRETEGLFYLLENKISSWKSFFEFQDMKLNDEYVLFIKFKEKNVHLKFQSHITNKILEEITISKKEFLKEIYKVTKQILDYILVEQQIIKIDEKERERSLKLLKNLENEIKNCES